VTALQEQRKLTGRCTRCGEPADATNLCDAHQADNNARSAASHAERRHELRQARCCVDCYRPSLTYRCSDRAACAAVRQMLTLVTLGG
jgi:hypothetical protein